MRPPGRPVAAQLDEDGLLPALYDDRLTPLRKDYRRRISDVLQHLATRHIGTIW